MKKWLIIFIVAFSCLPVSSYAHKYKSMEVKNGGSIRGTVRYTGKTVPQDRTYTLLSDVKYCGKQYRTEKYLINGDREIKNVVVYLAGIKAGKALPEKTLAIADKKCDIVPHVSIAFTGNKFKIENKDLVLHTAHIFAYMRGVTMFNIALPEQGSTVTRTLTRPGIMELDCDCHPWMRGYTYVFDQPYAAVTDENGEFVIDNIPPGTYTVYAWHEALGLVTMANVKVEGGKVSDIKLEYSTSPVVKDNGGM